MIQFAGNIIAVTLLAAFVLSLLNKWRILEWLQIHSPNEFLHKLFMCKFCCSWWVGVLVSAIWAVASGQYELFAIPFFSTVITKELW